MKRVAEEQFASMKIGELLVRDGFIKEADVQKGLDAQRLEAELCSLPLGSLLVKKSFISEDQLRSLLDHPELRRDAGMLAVERGIISEEQLAGTLKNMRTGERIEDALKREGFVPGDAFLKIREDEVDSRKLGELAVRLSLISRKQLDEALAIKRSQRTLGEIFCDLGLINATDLNHVLEKYNKRLKFGEILVKQAILSDDKVKTALQEQRHKAESLGNILLKKKLITPDQLYSTLSKQYNIPFRKLDGFVFQETQKSQLIGLIGQKYAEKHLVLPLSLEKDRLTIAVINPENLRTILEIRSLYTHLRTEFVLITEPRFEELFERLYGQAFVSTRVSVETRVAPEASDLMEIDLEKTAAADQGPIYGISDMEAEEVVNFIIKYGIINGASDIHIEQDRKGARLRYRIDGVLQTLRYNWLDAKLQEMVGAIISRIKVMSNLDIAERRIPQDGVFRINYYDKEKNQRTDLDFRVATCPAIVGENVTIRILDSRTAMVGLDTLNHSPHVLKPLMEMLKSSAGMVLVSGPTGSGKSSTLYAALNYIYHPGIKIITAEDPIEYSFPGIMQTQVKPKINLTFSRLLRSFLRLDPDVILVGEIRDEETAKIAFDAAQTGHLLLSTIHTNDAASAVTRLLDLHIEYNQIASSLMGVLAQRLVRRICPDCRKKYVPPQSEWELIFDRFPAELSFYKGEGCEACDYTGYKGRSLVSELLVIGGDVSLALNRGAGEKEIKRLAFSQGMLTMVDDGLLKLDQTTLAEIIRVTPHEMVKEFRSRKNDQPVAEGQTGEEIRPEAVTEERLVISDPASETPQIDRMFDIYGQLKRKNGGMPEGADAKIFREFIADAYRSVAGRYGCRNVAFTLKGRPHKVEIFASPAP